MKYRQIRLNEGFVGREFERERINKVAKLASEHPQILVVYGRRRTGKTELIEQVLAKRNIIKIEGLENQPLNVQIELALRQLAEYFEEDFIADLKFERWWDVFNLLKDKLEANTTLYFEEVQWLAGYSSDFAAELKFFWDNHFKDTDGLLIVLCGSSPSFMTNSIIRSRALYNRSQHVLHLKPFSIAETAEFLGDRHNPRQVLDVYLSVGGIPEYLKYFQNEPSAFIQLCSNSFVADSFFSLEFEKVFTSSLADNPQYRSIIEFLSNNKYADRSQILSHLKRKSGGDISEVITDLEDSELIKTYAPYDASTRTTLNRYHIWDPYLNFYYRFIHPKRTQITAGEFNDNPVRALNITGFQQFLSYSFERFCRNNHLIFSTLLGFNGVDYKSGAYFNSKTKNESPGFQWDLVYDRADKVITLCEVKYLQKPVSTKVIEEFENRLEKTPGLDQFRSIQKVLIAPLGASPELSERHYFDRVITLEDIFPN